MCCPRGPAVSKGRCCVLTASPSAPCAVRPVHTGSEQVPSLGQHSHSLLLNDAVTVPCPSSAPSDTGLSPFPDPADDDSAERHFPLHKSKPWGFGS